MAKEKGGDAIDQIIDQIKKLQERIDALDAGGTDTSHLEEKIAELEARLNRKADFGSWD